MEQFETTKNRNSLMMPYLVMSSPDGKKKKITIKKDKIIIGRFADLNDISLLPDPQKLVTRYMHCFVEIRKSTAWLIDNASKNGTFIKRKNVVEKLSGELKLQDNDVIMILGKIDETDPVQYWELLYKDPLSTENIESNSTTNLIYDWIQARLFINKKGKPSEVVSLTPLEHKLIRYMDQKNKLNNNVPVMCSYNELISALWEDTYPHAANDVNHIVAALRRKIEVDYEKPVFLENIRGLGYRLINNP